MLKNNQNLEALHDNVYGASFSLYNKKEMEKFIIPFQVRFEKNNIDPKTLFNGKKCLDAGCGNGRGSLFMAMHGAREIHSLDISSTNIESTNRNARLFGFSKQISTQQTSLENIPFEDESVDFVWCNGVLMHTHDPEKCLKELARVLKKNGKAWIYVYGAGGVYWYCVYKFRKLLQTYSEKDCLQVLEFMQTPIAFLAEYMDDWKVPYLRTYTNQDFSSKLESLGFDNINILPFGMSYDTSSRINLFPQDRIYLGEGDLRYLITKIGNNKSPCAVNLNQASEYDYPAIFTDPINKKFEKLIPYIQNNLLRKLMTFAFIQRNLRDNIFSNNREFDLNKLLNYFDQAFKYMELVPS